MHVRQFVCVLLIASIALGVSGCMSVSGDGWSSHFWPSESVTTDTKDHDPNENAETPHSPIQLVSWPPTLSTPWSSPDGTTENRFSSPLAPLGMGMETLQAGTNTLQKGATQLQAGGVRAWENTKTSSASAWNNTKRWLTPPLLETDPTGREPSFWQRLWMPAPAPPAARTTREFLSQERLQF